MVALKPEVFAAGGVVGRARPSKQLLVVHRPKYDDWTLPKGKRDPGETDEDCAVREVEEETGLRCTLGAELPRVRYIDKRGRLKEVRYWAMTAVSGRLQKGTAEVDEVRWLRVHDAQDLLTYVHDREIVAAWAALQ